ncbi:MAG: hypothetical protein HC897_02915 [Thermoanaerobaculia bacterium]|nr:hypothetical protein [Thermoanaerobaculia bacterium]
MPETLYGVGGDFAQDDPLHILTGADQAAAELLLTLDRLDKKPLDRLKGEIYPQFSQEIAQLAGERELSWWLATFLEDKFHKEQGPNFRSLEPQRAKFIHEQLLWEKCIDVASIKPEVEALYESMADAFHTLAQWISELNIWCQPIVRLLLETLGDWKYLEAKNIKCTACRWGHRVEYFADADRDAKEWDLPIPHMGIVPTLYHTNPFHCEIHGHWNPFDETRERAQKRLLRVFQKKLTEYLDQTEQLARKEGTAAPRKRDPASHFEWLVRYQIHGWDYGKVATKYGRVEKTISDGIQRTAALLNLELIRRKAGRPPGKKESHKRHRV